ncbi:hypothetical protein ACFXAS_31305 [Streptomyces sp. NPDC059459]|uniref:hypothetical protein n=1 Tax=Streptomyces sp. NPDC059459 TaxID=3346839 RepID=UPI003691AD4E
MLRGTSPRAAFSVVQRVDEGLVDVLGGSGAADIAGEDAGARDGLDGSVLAGGVPEPRDGKRRRKPREEVREAEPEQPEQPGVPEAPPKPEASAARAGKSRRPEGQGTLF